MQQIIRTRNGTAALRRLLQHLVGRKDVQSIDLMNLAALCSHCLAKWHVTGSGSHGAGIDLDQAREIIYGISHVEWERLYPKEATAKRLQMFAECGQSRGKPNA